MDTGYGLQAILLRLVLHPCFSCILRITPVHVWQMMRKAAKKGGERQKTLQSDGIAGVCIQRIRYIMRIVAFYFGMHDALKPLLLTGKLQRRHWIHFLLVSLLIQSGLASYPTDTVRRRMIDDVRGSRQVQELSGCFLPDLEE
ncbi:Mitochondrial carrier protein [Musa troglodytarum]|uniref:ADP/ATP translocase n=1 Tax=Musa troglodytarum TaxID=320322 RepID=A0A9E7GX10_9LILI|nr:Mitochondrial carrier protein [Musa troglodytarum]